jgi:hypothetical protein
MRKAFAIAIGAALLAPLAASAQDKFTNNHVEIGVFGDYLRAHTSSQNLLGVGGRLGFAVHPNVKLEVDGAYDFEHNYSSTITGACPGGTSGVTSGNCGTTSNGLRATHFSFGPKFQLGTRSNFHLFAFAKGGFVRFGSSSTPVTFGNFPTATSGTDMNGVFYPGGGIEVFAKWIGIRADVGDEMYFDRGANNNLRITFGPVIRF